MALACDVRNREEIDRVVTGHRAVVTDARQRGILLGVERLKRTSTATTVRMNDGLPMTIDGPFAETKEQLAGYYILECKDLDEAIDWARRIRIRLRVDRFGVVREGN